MANTGFSGVDVRQSGNQLIFRASVKDSAGAKVTSGTTSLYIYEIQSDGTLKSYDFNDNTFKTTALTTETASMTHRTGNNGTTNTGLWLYALSTLTGFTRGGMYMFVVSNTSAVPPQQEREFQYGAAEGDLAASVTSAGKVPATVAAGDLAADSLTASALATDAVQEIRNAITGGAYALSTDSNGRVRIVDGTGTGEIDTSSGTVIAGTVSDKTGYALSSGGVQAIWDALTSALTTVGSIGKRLADDIDATISSRSSHAASDIWAVATRLLTAGTNIVLAKGVGLTGLNDLDAAGVRTAVGLASANLDTQLDALPTANENRAAITGGAYALDTDANGRIRIVDGSGAGELDTNAGGVKITGTLQTLDSLFSTQLAESYAANGVVPTLPQAVLAIHQFLMDFAISGTSYGVHKFDGSSAFNATLDSATTPTSCTR